MVHYAWHPLHGQQVEVRTGERYCGIVRCFVSGSEDTAKLLPEWMLDEVACGKMRVARVACVAPSALEAVGLLLVESGAVDSVADPFDAGVHGPNAIENEDAPARADGGEAVDPAVGRAAGRLPPRGRRVAGQTAAQRGIGGGGR